MVVINRLFFLYFVDFNFALSKNNLKSLGDLVVITALNLFIINPFKISEYLYVLGV
jgi:hypothetical protein